MIRIFDLIKSVFFFFLTPIAWVLGTIIFALSKIFAIRQISWLFAAYFIWTYAIGIREVLLLPFGLIIGGHEYLLFVVISFFLIAPFAAKSAFRATFKYGLWQYLKDPFGRKNRPQKSRAKKSVKQQAVQIVAPHQTSVTIKEVVSRLPPHLKRLIAGEG